MKNDKPLRLLVYQRAYWPLFGGYAHHLRYRLKLMTQFGIEPWVLTQRIGDCKSEEFVDDVLVRRIRVPLASNMRQILAEAALFPALVKHNAHFDLALISSANISGPFIRDICGRPVIRESVIGENHARKFTSTPLGMVRKFCFRKVDFVVAISPALERAYLDVAWPRDRICLIPRGVDNEAFRPPSSIAEIDSLRRILGMPERPSLLYLSVGAIRERKAQLDLVEAWRLLSSEIPDEHLVIVGPVGENSYYQALKKRICDLGFGHRIHLVGRSDRVAEYMRCVDGFVFSSKNEGFPNSVIEAMSSGLPVVAFDIEGITSFIIDDGKDGILVPTGDQHRLAEEVKRLSENLDLRRRIGWAARDKTIRRFSLEKEAEAHADLYWRIHQLHRSTQ